MSETLSEKYAGRKLADGYPGLDDIATAHFSETPMGTDNVRQTMKALERLVSLPAANKKVAVVGCGPMPFSLRLLKEMGYDAEGVEPVPSFAANARKFLGKDAGIEVRVGGAESLPLADESVSVVLLESVLEHVDSPTKTLAEAYRVLVPGGVAFVETTNRLRFHPLGHNGEYNLPFYNFYPATLKEAFVHHHLHYRPKLANYSTRPAVHWFTYADLCARGREAGFYKFYARFDGITPEDPELWQAQSKLRRFIFSKIRQSLLLRTLALVQFGAAIYMLKRPQ